MSEARPAGVPTRASRVGFATEPLLRRWLLRRCVFAPLREIDCFDSGSLIAAEVAASECAGRVGDACSLVMDFFLTLIPGFRSLRTLHPGLYAAASFAGSAPDYAGTGAFGDLLFLPGFADSANCK